MREKLIDLLKDTRANAAWHHWGYEESADYLIANDVVPVVRCKDCKYRYFNEYQEMYCCEAWGDGFDTVVCQDEFCSHGERKDNV